MNARLAVHLEALRRALGTHPSADRIVAEAEDHLTESVHRLRRAGHDEDHAVTVALERWGTPDVVANRFAAESGPAPLRRRRPLRLLLALAGVKAASRVAKSTLAPWLPRLPLGHPIDL